MTRKGKILSFLGGLAVLIGLPAMLDRFLASPVAAPAVSPGGQFEIRYYEGFSPGKFLPTTPGNGGDNIAGYIALFDRTSNRELKRKHVRFLNAAEPKWFDDEVFFVGEIDTSWKLPRKDLP